MTINNRANAFISKQLEKIKTNDIPAFKAGDLLKVFVKQKDRELNVEGRCIAVNKKGTLDGTFTIFFVTCGVGVRRTFPFFQPERVEIISRGRVRRAKLNYLQHLRGKSARIEQIKQYKNN